MLAEKNDGDIYQAIVAACSAKTDVMVLESKRGRVSASFAVDTGAAVNVLSAEAYRAIKRALRGGRLPLRPHNLNLMGVGSENLEILGLVSLPINLKKGTPTIRCDFYVVTSFSLPSDGLIGMRTLKSSHMVIYPDINSVKYHGKVIKAMDTPMRLSSHQRGQVKDTDTVGSLPVQAVPTVQISLADAREDAPASSSETCLSSSTTYNPTESWKVVNATVVGDHEIPHRTAMPIPVSVPEASVGCDICLEGPSPVKRLVVENTLNTVREGHKTHALVVNTTGETIKLKQGVLLSQALAFDKQVVPEPLELPKSEVSTVAAISDNQEPGSVQTLDSLVTVVDYPENKPLLIKLLQRYRDVIALPGEALGATDRTEHNIKLKPGTKPVYIPAYRLPHSQRKVVDEQIKEMLDQGVIQNSKSPWNSPLFLVPKKDGTYRPVIDFRKVNEVTENDRYPLPVLKDLLMSLGKGNKMFSSLDLLSGYWQVPMAPESREVTAFSTPQGHYEWLRMPFGLKSAPITFQRMINTLFADLLGKHVYAFLDDIIISSENWESHIKTLEEVLLRLKEAGLKAKLTKCEFLKRKITFLGHEVDGDGIHTMSDKVKAVQKFPQPKNVENVRSFLGLCGYYRSFIKNFAALASPLNQLLKKEVPFHWNAAQEKSFQDLKEALCNAPVLAFPDYEAPFIIYTDASALGLGAVLMQQDARGKNCAIAYASRTLNSAESNYSVTHQETLAVVWALKHFRDIVFGYPITIYTDHAAVTEIFKGRNLTGRLARWYLTITEFNPTFKYLPGRANVVADALSRNVHVGAVLENTAVIQNFTLKELATAQRHHKLWGRVIYSLESGDETNLPPLPIPFSQFFLTQDGVLCRYWPHKTDPVPQFVIPEQFVPTILKLIHDEVVAGHPGKERTLAAARRKYFWPTMRIDIDEYVSGCIKCAQNKGTVPKPAPILEYPPPERPWDVVSIDLLQLPTSRQGSQYLLVCVDHFSRFVVMAPLKNKTASSIAHALVSHLFCPYSTPRVILSDNASEFRSSLLDEICNQYQIKQTFTTIYHPASNGLVERANRKILDVLRPVVGGLLETWEDWLPHVAASINGSICESTGQSPHFIIYGVEKRLPYDLLSSPKGPVYNVDDYAKCQLKVFSDIHRDVREQLKKSQATMTSQQHRRSSPITIKAGDSVMVKVPERNSKLSPKFVGPRLVTKQMTGNKFEVFDPWLNTVEVVHSDRLKKTNAKPELNLVETANTETATRLGTNETETEINTNNQTQTNINTNNQIQTHNYNLRPRS